MALVQSLPVAQSLAMTDDRRPISIPIRPVRTDDRIALTAFYAGLCGDSQRQRFHAMSAGLPAGTARFMCGPDHQHREGFVAVTPGPAGTEMIVGHLCLEPDRVGGFEMAVAVADNWRRRGIGRSLLTSALFWARRHRVARMSAVMLVSSPAIMGLIASVGPQVKLSSGSAGVVDALIDVETACRELAHPAARRRAMQAGHAVA